MHFLYGLCHECSNEYGDGRDPYILGSEESYYEVHEDAVWFKSAEDACDELRDPYYCCSISDIDGDVLERDVLTAPELSGKCLCLFKVDLSGLDFIDQRVLEVLAEPAVPCEEDKYKEVDGHQQVIRNCSSSGNVLTCSILRCHSREVYSAADVGTGHHRGYSCEVLSIAVRSLQQEVSEISADYGSNSTDEEYHQHSSGLSPDLLQVTLEKQHRDAERNDDAPYDIVIKHAGCRNNSQVSEHHSDDQSDDSAGNLRSPCIFLLQPDGEEYAHGHDHEESPHVIGCDQRLTAD